MKVRIALTRPGEPHHDTAHPWVITSNRAHTPPMRARTWADALWWVTGQTDPWGWSEFDLMVMEATA